METIRRSSDFCQEDIAAVVVSSHDVARQAAGRRRPFFDLLARIVFGRGVTGAVNHDFDMHAALVEQQSRAARALEVAVQPEFVAPGAGVAVVGGRVHADLEPGSIGSGEGVDASLVDLSGGAERGVDPGNNLTVRPEFVAKQGVPPVIGGEV